MTKVFAQIVVDVEMDSEDLTDAQAGLECLITKTSESLKDYTQHSATVRILETYTPTKDWQIGAQLALGQDFQPRIKDPTLPRFIFDTQNEMHEVLRALQELISKYGVASVQDLYDLIGSPGPFGDSKWGWRNLTTSYVKFKKTDDQKWELLLPRVVWL